MNIEPDSSDESFISDASPQQSKTTNAIKNVDKTVSKRKKSCKDAMSDSETDCSISSKKQKQSKSEAKNSITAVRKSRERVIDVSERVCL